MLPWYLCLRLSDPASSQVPTEKNYLILCMLFFLILCIWSSASDALHTFSQVPRFLCCCWRLHAFPGSTYENQLACIRAVCMRTRIRARGAACMSRLNAAANLPLALQESVCGCVRVRAGVRVSESGRLVHIYVCIIRMYVCMYVWIVLFYA